MKIVNALLVSALLLASPIVASAAPCDGALCAGAASVDMTWHVGAGQGQYGTEGNGLTSDKFDPFHHQTKMVPSDGMQSRAFAKAIVIRGADGVKVAYAKTELYLQQDMLTRRVAELVSGTDPLAQDFVVPGLDGSRIMIGTTHNHSAPYYASTAYGVWLFTDTLDLRMYDYTARRIAEAIFRADAVLQPAKIGASVSRFSEVQRNILGPAVADDGSPAGFPFDYFDDELAVIRFDRADGSAPIAAWVNLGMHPESTEGVDLISSDFVGMVERLVERGMGRNPGEDGPVVAWSQGSVGDVEPDQSGRAHPQSQDREFWHRNFAQAELMSERISTAVLDTWNDVAAETPDVPETFVPFSTVIEVAMTDRRFAGPIAHPVPTVSNCRTEEPGIPIVGLPDCERPGEAPEQLGTTIDLLQSAGIPVPDNYGAPSHGGVQESYRIHLQVMRLGDIVIGSCPCEPVSDMTKNFKSRADVTQTNQHFGYHWQCTGDPGARQCNFQRAAHLPADWKPVEEAAYQRMIAEIENDAAGWEEDYASLQGEAEAEDPAAINGNYTHEELPANLGYRLPIMIGQANDYIGYIVTYREYMRGDHYRKALTAFGPHTSDYVNTRLVRMAAELKGGIGPADALPDPAMSAADELAQSVKLAALGQGSSGATTVYDAAIPDDGGEPGTVAEPLSLERFGAAQYTWIGGSNWTDNPEVRVERQVDGDWQTVATQEGGEVVLTLEYDSYLSQAPLDWLTGGKTYRWTATFEAFDRTAPGFYRFVVEGRHRKNRTANPYALTSETFEVTPWSGIAVSDLVVNAATGTVSFRVSGVENETALTDLETDDDAVLGPTEIHYPDTYSAPLAFLAAGLDRRVDENGVERRYCYRCTFRPWADTGEIVSAAVTVNGVEHQATPPASPGEPWVVSGLVLTGGETIGVEPGDVVDEFGNFNGDPQ